LLVVSSCSARKRAHLPEPPGFDDLADPVRRAELHLRYAHLLLPAREQYVGRHHLAVGAAVARLRGMLATTRVTWTILSAGYGVLDADDEIIPYDASFAGLRPSEALARAERLGMRAALTQRLRAHEVALILLSATYLGPLDPPLLAAGLELYFAPAEYARLAAAGVLYTAAGISEARLLGVAPREVKATLLSAFANLVEWEGWGAALAAVRAGALAERGGRAAGAEQLSLALP
jgi:hypothetical protein